LKQVRDGTMPVDSAMDELRYLPYEDLGYARLDHHRALRTGLPETVFCQGKTPDQVVNIMRRLSEQSRTILGTRASEEVYEKVREWNDEAVYHKLARVIVVGGRKDPGTQPGTRGKIVVASAGTSDMPVAEEAAVCAEVFGNPVERVYDIGVAGIHRLFGSLPVLQTAEVLIVVAGMDGALPGVVAGLVDRPVLAVPTSVGYGASFGGVAALLTMLNSCAPGVAVLNIDNGYGAAVFAHTINQRRE